MLTQTLLCVRINVRMLCSVENDPPLPPLLEHLPIRNSHLCFWGHPPSHTHIQRHTDTLTPMYVQCSTATVCSTAGITHCVCTPYTKANGGDTAGTNRQRARLIKTQRKQLLKQLNKLREKSEDVDSAKSHFSLQQVSHYLDRYTYSTHILYTQIMQHTNTQN